jgi:predicted RND superfamily exporter protein
VVETQFSERSAALIERQALLVEAVRDIAARYREHASIFVGGVPMIAADMISFVRSDLVVFGSAILGVMVLILALIFRRVRWVVIPVLACSVSVSLMLGLLAALDWRMTVISSNFVAVLLIVALAIAIHLVVRYRELHAADPAGDTRARVRETVRLMAVPCVYTGVTTMVAFTSLVVSGIQPVIDFGLMMTVGIVVALLVTFTLVPAAMLLWPRARALQAAAGATPMTVRVAGLVEAHGRSIIVLTLLLCAVLAWGISRLQVENRFIDYFKETTEIYQGMELLDSQLGGTIPLEVVLAAPDRSAPLPGLEPSPGGEAAADAVLAPIDEDDPFADEQAGFGAPSAAAGSAADDLAEDDPFLDEGGFAADDPFAADDFATTAQGGNFTPSYWFSLEGMRLIDAVHRTVDAREETGKVLSLSTTFSVVRDLLGEDIGSVELALVQRSLPPDVAQLMVAPYFDTDRDEARLTVRVKETSENLRRAVFLRQLRTELAGLDGLDADQIRFTGMLVLYNNVLQSLFTSQILTLGAVFAVILLMFWALFRSLTLALLALLPNLLAASLVLGIMGLAGIPLDIMTVTIAAIVVGMGVDNCIHYVHRFKREFPRDRNYLATMYRCHGTIGRALYYTTLTVVVGFSMLTLSNFRPSIYFGLLTVLAMVAAVVGALVLLPRLIILFRPLGREA